MTARLRRTSPDQPGWTRRRAGRGFVYLDAAGARLSDADAERCRALVIPPAWQDVWICPHANGHLQAVGLDEAGRRQYLYHPDWVERRSAEKFDRAVRFGKRLPRVRERVAIDLGSDRLDRAAACAVGVRLLDLGCFRVGSDVYAEENGSFGLTTLERRHVRRRRGRLVFDFAGKSGVEHHVEIDDAAVVEVVERMRRRRSADPHLLAYRDGRRWRMLAPLDVNDYLRETAGVEGSAKDFRTWHGTVLAAAALADSAPCDADGSVSGRARARAVRAALQEVADFLGNTPALARSAYVDPRVIDAYDEGRTIRRAVRRLGGGADPAERQAVLERATIRLIAGR